jgi:excisionase family DNA binding protein
VEQAAKYLGIAKQTVYLWCSEKKIPHKKIGSKTFFDADELDYWVARHKVRSMSEVVKARPASKSRK